MKHQFEIREAVRCDADEISLLISTLSRKFIVPDCTYEGTKRLLGSMTADSINRYLFEGYRYYIALQNDHVVGVIGIKDNSEIYHLFVSEFNQGQGLSRKLWQVAKDECVLRGNKGFFTVNSAVNAKNVYLRFGFSATGGIIDNRGIKEIPMELHL